MSQRTQLGIGRFDHYLSSVLTRRVIKHYWVGFGLRFKRNHVPGTSVYGLSLAITHSSGSDLVEPAHLMEGADYRGLNQVTLLSVMHMTSVGIVRDTCYGRYSAELQGG